MIFVGLFAVLALLSFTNLSLRINQQEPKTICSSVARTVLKDAKCIYCAFAIDQ